MAWKHAFLILFLFHHFLISLDLVHVCKFVNQIFLTYTVLKKLSECNCDILFTYRLLAVITQQQEKQLKLVYLSCLVGFTIFFQNLIAYSLFLVLILSLLLLVSETLSLFQATHSLLYRFPLKPFLFYLVYD